MLEVMSECEPGVLAVRAHGVLTRDDYRDVLVPRVDAAVEAVGTIRVLFLMDEAFRGWDARAAWSNTCLDVRHRRTLEKVAIVGAPTWEQWCAKLADLLIAGKIKTFRRDELSTAWTWLRE